MFLRFLSRRQCHSPLQFSCCSNHRGRFWPVFMDETRTRALGLDRLFSIVMSQEKNIENEEMTGIKTQLGRFPRVTPSFDDHKDHKRSWRQSSCSICQKPASGPDPSYPRNFLMFQKVFHGSIIRKKMGSIYKRTLALLLDCSSGRKTMYDYEVIFLVNQSLRACISHDPGWNMTLLGSF